MTTADILLRAAELLERGGWCQNARSIGARHCALGAIDAVTNNNNDYYAARLRLREYVGRAPAFWNDDPTRTASEVIAAMREAAKQ